MQLGAGQGRGWQLDPKAFVWLGLNGTATNHGVMITPLNSSFNGADNDSGSSGVPSPTSFSLQCAPPRASSSNAGSGTSAACVLWQRAVVMMLAAAFFVAVA
jgi:hypothetical protein